MSRTGTPAYAGEMERVVTSVFDTMMGLNVEPVDAPWHPGRDRLVAAVQLIGMTNGVIVLETDQQHARKFAGCLLGMEPPETVDDDVRDALGELANVIGGNLKEILAPGAILSIPSAVDGAQFSVRICHCAEVERQAFSTDGGVFWVTWMTLGSSGQNGAAAHAGAIDAAASEMGLAAQ